MRVGSVGGRRVLLAHASKGVTRNQKKAAPGFPKQPQTCVFAMSVEPVYGRRQYVLIHQLRRRDDKTVVVKFAPVADGAHKRRPAATGGLRTVIRYFMILYVVAMNDHVPVTATHTKLLSARMRLGSIGHICTRLRKVSRRQKLNQGAVP